MKRRPLDNEAWYAWRQPSRKHCQSPNIDQRKVTILRMKMWWVVIVEGHLDDNAEETVDLRRWLRPMNSIGNWLSELTPGKEPLTHLLLPIRLRRAQKHWRCGLQPSAVWQRTA
jgi:hypothetical protein